MQILRHAKERENEDQVCWFISMIRWLAGKAKSKRLSRNEQLQQNILQQDLPVISWNGCEIFGKNWATKSEPHQCCGKIIKPASVFVKVTLKSRKHDIWLSIIIRSAKMCCSELWSWSTLKAPRCWPTKWQSLWLVRLSNDVLWDCGWRYHTILQGECHSRYLWWMEGQYESQSFCSWYFLFRVYLIAEFLSEAFVRPINRGQRKSRIKWATIRSKLTD